MIAVAGRWAPILVGAVPAAVLVCACSSASNPVSHGSTSQAGFAGRQYSLYTHCGVREARIGNTYYAADHPLDDGRGNPPSGWGNPYQEGSITMPTPSTALFRDGLGHVVRFHTRPGARRPSFKFARS